MSNGNLEINGYILNKDRNKDNIPDWILLYQNKSYYDDQRGNEFRSESKIKAKALGLDITKDEKTFLAIIYAGHTYRSEPNTLNPEAFINSNEYIMGEKFVSGKPYNEERDDNEKNPVSTFAHIGIHAHELGHLLGFEDLKGGMDNDYWCLMSKGNFNGPNNEGACPAPINPYYRSMLGWIELNTINKAGQKKLRYRLSDPDIYQLKDTCSNCFFLVECRKFNCKMKMGNNKVYDYNSYIRDVNSENGILVWRKLKGNFVKLVHSSGLDNGDPEYQIFPGKLNVTVLTPWSDSREVEAGYFWVPNTKPTDNCGMEIMSQQEDFIEVKFFQLNPDSASPSKPKKLKYYCSRYIELSWDRNQEPDMAYYRIYKSIENGYTLYDSTADNYYIDTIQSVSSNKNTWTSIFYKISAVDLEQKESTFSSEVKISRTDIVDINEHFAISNQPLFYQNYPNPFNNSTKLSYSIPKSSHVSLKIYDIIGREVATLVDEVKLAGEHELLFDSKEYKNSNSSGVYIFRMTVDNRSLTRKGLFIK
jgi:M6 family metalloprotease-like protein